METEREREEEELEYEQTVSRACEWDVEVTASRPRRSVAECEEQSRGRRGSAPSAVSAGRAARGREAPKRSNRSSSVNVNSNSTRAGNRSSSIKTSSNGHSSHRASSDVQQPNNNSARNSSSRSSFIHAKLGLGMRFMSAPRLLRTRLSTQRIQSSASSIQLAGAHRGWEAQESAEGGGEVGPELREGRVEAAGHLQRLHRLRVLRAAPSASASSRATPRWRLSA
mmetsp:Transcript_4145/g.9832  ORF Transcript_4145/g.9832 Transcript_4145/m.9832 type:complete len:225 (-) Transcript_4145:382-1056(-)